jgi:hypothetical protein
LGCSPGGQGKRKEALENSLSKSSEILTIPAKGRTRKIQLSHASFIGLPQRVQDFSLFALPKSKTVLRGGGVLVACMTLPATALFPWLASIA